MHKVKFYFDPSCPFTWITSRWLLEAQTERDIDIDWQPFSLAIKNNTLDQATDDKYAIENQASHRLMRLMVAATERGASMADMYTYIGRQYHVETKALDNQLIDGLLSAFGLPHELTSQADDTSRDEHLAQLVKNATSLTGEDVGVPIIVFVNDNGPSQGYFGPVLQTLPSIEESTQLWDGLSKLATVDSFYEIKRSRPQGGPDVDSTR